MQSAGLTISHGLLQRIREHCLEEKPVEACGILTGQGSLVLHAYATDNTRQSPIFYEVDPEQQERVLSEMEQRGDRLLAIYHSHPTGEPVPSANDIRLAVHYPEALRVIISLSGTTQIRAFRITHGRVQEVPILASPTASGTWHDLRAGGSATPEARQ